MNQEQYSKLSYTEKHKLAKELVEKAKETIYHMSDKETSEQARLVKKTDNMLSLLSYTL